MIKKPQSLALAAFAALFSASAFAGGPEMLLPAPNPFDGFFIGGTVSLNQTGYEIDSSLQKFRTKRNCSKKSPGLTTTTTIASQDGGDTDTEVYGGVRGGWGKTFRGRWYGAVEGFGSFGNSDGDISTTLFPGSTSFSLTQTNDAHVGSQWGVDAKLGLLLSPTTLAYTRLGVIWADVEATIDVNQTVASDAPFAPASGNIIDASNQKNQSAFLWGFGLEQFVWGDMVSIFAEYTHANFNSVSVSAQLPATTEDFQPSNGIILNNSVKPELSTFTGGVNFHFRGPFTRWI